MTKQYNSDSTPSTGPCQIQKIYATPLFLCLSIRRPGETLWVWLGRQKPYLGGQLNHTAPAAPFRIKDVAVEWLRSKFSGRWLQSFRFNPDNGALELVEVSGEVVLVLGWSNGRLAYLEARRQEQGGWECQRSDQEKIFEVDDWRMVDFFDEVKPLRSFDAAVELEAWVQKQSNQIIKKNQQKKRRKSENIQADIEKLKKHIFLYELARDHQALMASDELQHHGVKLKFAAAMNAYQRADLVFEKAKRFKKALELQLKRLEEVLKKEKKTDDQPRYQLSAHSLHWKFGPNDRSAVKVMHDEKSPGQIISIELPDGAKVVVGTSAQTNDYLRKNWAQKDDLWAHIENVTGSHLFYRGDSDPSLELWGVIASILRDYSKIEAEQVTLVWTKARYLKAVKGAPGKVRFSHEKRITLNYEPRWRNLLAL